MNSSTDICNKLDALAAQGIAVTVSASRTLQVRPGSQLDEVDREWLRAHAGAILAHLGDAFGVSINGTLSGNEPWDGRVALKLIDEADVTVERSGVDGRHPAVKDAAAMVTSAFATRDLETLRFAVSELTLVVRQLARGRASSGASGQTSANTSGAVLTSVNRVPHAHPNGTGCVRGG